jgi:FkbM family methyltransferase
MSTVSVRDAARLLYRVSTGKSPVCSWRQVLKSQALSNQVESLVEEIVKSAKVLESDASGPQLWDTKLARIWFPSGGKAGQLAACLAEQQIGVYVAGTAGVRNGSVVLDCGANIGAFTRKAVADGASLVVAIEPAPQNRECLSRNVAEHIKTGRVVIYPKGLWDQEGVLSLNMDIQNPLRHSTVTDRGWNTATEIAVTTIDRLVSEMGLAKVDFIKMDVEGAELRALAGGRETIIRHKPALAIAVEHGSDLIANARAVIDLISGTVSGYRWDCPYCSELGDGLIFPEVLVFEHGSK